MSPSPLPSCGFSKMESTLLKIIKAIYNCQKLGLIPKLQVDFLKERPSLLFQVTTSRYSCDLDFLICTCSVATRFLAATLISGRDINYSRDFVDYVVFKS